MPGSRSLGSAGVSDSSSTTPVDNTVTHSSTTTIASSGSNCRSGGSSSRRRSSIPEAPTAAAAAEDLKSSKEGSRNSDSSVVGDVNSDVVNTSISKSTTDSIDDSGSTTNARSGKTSPHVTFEADVVAEDDKSATCSEASTSPNANRKDGLYDDGAEEDVQQRYDERLVPARTEDGFRSLGSHTTSGRDRFRPRSASVGSPRPPKLKLARGFSHSNDDKDKDGNHSRTKRHRRLQRRQHRHQQQREQQKCRHGSLLESSYSKNKNSEHTGDSADGGKICAFSAADDDDDDGKANISDDAFRTSISSDDADSSTNSIRSTFQRIQQSAADTWAFTVNTMGSAAPDCSAEDEELWSAKHKVRLMVAFILLNIILLVVRLLTVCVNLQYLVHSCVVFLDLLIVCVSFRGVWFRSLAFLPCAICAGLYSWTELVVFEILETTMLALVATMKDTHHRVFVHRAFGHVPKRHPLFKTILLELFDGSSGVLYTSFFGLILVEAFKSVDIGKEKLFCV